MANDLQSHEDDDDGANGVSQSRSKGIPINNVRKKKPSSLMKAEAMATFCMNVLKLVESGHFSVRAGNMPCWDSPVLCYEEVQFYKNRVSAKAILELLDLEVQKEMQQGYQLYTVQKCSAEFQHRQFTQ